VVAAPPNLIRIPLALLVLGIIAVPWTVAVRELSNPAPVRTTARPNAIVWGTLVFTKKQDLERWLRSHGASYGKWSDRHPTALLAKPRPVHVAPKAAAPRRHATRPKSAAKNRVVETARVPTVAPAGRSVVAEALELLLLSLGTLAVVLAFTPVPMLRTVLRGHHQSLTPDTRIYIAGGGLVTLVGVLISVMIGS
jgi:hypothetical protein